MENAAEEEQVVDRISVLPNSLLGSIVSLLPPKAAARTMVLSRRWRRIWRWLPLDLDLNSADSDVALLKSKSIQSILSSHHGRIRRFRVTTPLDLGTRGWLQTLARRRIDDTFALSFTREGVHTPLPHDLLARACVFLRNLHLHCCALRFADDHRPFSRSFPHLDYLCLSDMSISETALHSMLASCPSLRELHLLFIFGLRRIALRSDTLAAVYIGRPNVPLDEFSLRDTPNLAKLSFTYVDLWRIPTFTIDAPRLQHTALKLPILDDSMGLSFFAPNERPLPFITSLSFSMKLNNGADELRKAATMLDLFPCLRRLEVWCLNIAAKKKARFEQWEPAAETTVCLNKRLTDIVMKGYRGMRAEMEYARYLVARAKVLASMEIIHSANWSGEDINRQKDLICTGVKASTSAQLYFSQRNEVDAHRREVIIDQSGLRII